MNCWREEGAWRPFRRLKPARVNVLRFCVAKAKKGNAAVVSASRIKLVGSDNSDSEEGFRIERKTGAEGEGAETPYASSSDNGQTWSGIMGMASLPQTHAGICPRTLNDGSHICILNPSTDWRNRLDLMTSTDGLTWKLALILNPSEDGEIRSHIVSFKTRDFLTWSEPLLAFYGREMGLNGFTSPSIHQFGERYILVFGRWSTPRLTSRNPPPKGSKKRYTMTATHKHYREEP